MSTFDSLDETFDITPNKGMEAMKPIKKPKVDLVISDKKEDAQKDYQYARSQIYNLVDKMTEAVDGALEVAQESDHPRAYEVVLNGAKSAAEVVEKLADLHKKMDDADARETKATANMQGGTQNNIFFSGSTSELMEMMKEQQKEADK